MAKNVGEKKLFREIERKRKIKIFTFFVEMKIRGSPVFIGQDMIHFRKKPVGKINDLID